MDMYRPITETTVNIAQNNVKRIWRSNLFNAVETASKTSTDGCHAHWPEPLQTTYNTYTNYIHGAVWSLPIALRGRRVGDRCPGCQSDFTMALIQIL